MKIYIKRLLTSLGLMPIGSRFMYYVRKILCTRSLWLDYMSSKNLRPFLREFRNQALRFGWQDENGRDAWCKYLVVLNELENEKEFSKAFTKYVSGNELNIKNLANYLTLAHEGIARGILDQDVLYTDKVFTILKKNHQECPLSEFVNGKTIAVVGNGPSEIGKGLGPEIDAHDYVIRINNHSINGFEKDYGTRTDIWAKHTTDYIKHNIQDENIKYIIYASNWMREKIPLRFRQAIVEDAKTRIIDFCGIENRAYVSDRFKIHPLTGTLIIDMLYRSKMKYLDAYGFSFLETKKGEYRHYMNDMSTEKLASEVSVHNTNVETEYLKSLFKNSRRLYPLK